MNTWPPSGRTTLRKQTDGGGQLRVPNSMAAFLEDGTHYEVCWHDEGILYRPITELKGDVPEWVKEAEPEP